MKNRISKLFAVGLTVALLASLFAFGAPVSAGTLTWTSEVIPGPTDNVTVAAGTSVTDIAVGGDGTTIWAARGAQWVFKSSNEGASWSQVDVVAASISYNVAKVAIAPDDNNYLAVATSNNTVLISTNGGTTWGTLGVPVTGMTINDIDISGVSSGIHWVAVAGVSAGGASQVLKWGIGGATPSWTDISAVTGFYSATTSTAFALQYSPNFPSDQLLVVATEQTTGSTDNVSLQLYSQNSNQWNSDAGFSGYPAVITSDTTITGVTAGDIGLAPDYLGSDDSLRLAFVGLTLAGTTTTKSGIWRMDDAAATALKTGSAVQINSVAYDGATLVAGAYDVNTTYYSTDATVSSPTVTTTRAYKRPGIDGASDAVVLAFAGADVVAGVSNPGAFSVSKNNGVAYNDISLVANPLTTLTDVFVSPDGSKTYLATKDGTYLSLWAKADSSWKRVLAVASTASFIVRQAPDDADVVYVAAQNDATKKIFYTTDGGEDRWQIRAANVQVQDLAVESDGSVVYALTTGGRVSKSTNAGFTWGPTDGKATTLASGFMIASAGEGKVIVGSSDGYVAFSTDSGDTWTKVIKQVGDTSAAVVLTSTANLSSGGFIYAALQNSNTGIYRWPFGAADTVWDTIKATTASAYRAYGIALGDGALYVSTSNGSDSTTYRTLSPAIPKALVSWSTMSSTGAFNITPQGLRASTGSVKLWAINTEGTDSLFSYLDTLVGVSPALVGPVDNFTNPMNLINGYPSNIVFSWSKPSDEALIYDLWIATDTAFNDTIIKTTTTSPTPVVSLQVTGDQFNQEQTYYWRTRVASNGPIQSAWSAVRSFYIEAATPTPPVSINNTPPNITITPPDVIVNVPPVVTVPPATTVTPAWIYVIIVIGALLLIAVIILIVRTRRAP